MCQPQRVRYVSDDNFDYPNKFEDFGSPRRLNRHRRDKNDEFPNGVKLTIPKIQGKSNLMHT